MRLSEALQINGRTAGDRQRNVHLLCGFEPLHLATFFKAHLRLRFPGDAIAIQTGLYGDLAGNIQRAAQNSAEGALAVIEWSDLDQRLGFRSSSGWSSQTLGDIATQAEEKCARLETHLEVLAEEMPVTVASPSLALPPLTYLPPSQTSKFELHLQAVLVNFLNRLSQGGSIKLLNAATLAASLRKALATTSSWTYWRVFLTL